MWWGVRRRVLEGTHHITPNLIPYPLQPTHSTLPELSDPEPVLAITATCIYSTQHTAHSTLSLSSYHSLNHILQIMICSQPCMRLIDGLSDVDDFLIFYLLLLPLTLSLLFILPAHHHCHIPRRLPLTFGLPSLRAIRLLPCSQSFHYLHCRLSSSSSSLSVLR